MSDEAIQIVLTGKIDGKIATSLRAIATEADRADTSLDQLRATLSTFNIGSVFKSAVGDVRELRNEVNRANATQKLLTGSVTATTAEIKKAATASRQLGTELKNVEVNTVRSTTQFNNMRGVMSNLIGTFASFFAIQQWSNASDAMISYENRLKVVGLEGEALNATMGRLSAAALKNGQSLDGLSSLYQKVASASRDIGASQQDMLRFVDAVAAGLRIQGASANTAQGALLQLSQAIGSARVEAQEFNSLVEGAYPLAQAAARGIDGFAGSVAKLQAFIRSGGTITGEQLFSGILAGLDELEGKVAKTQLTIGQSLQNLTTRFQLWTRETQGSAALVSNAIEFIGKNLNTIIPLIVAFGAAWATVKLVQLVAEFGALVKVIWGAVAAFTAANAVALLWVGIAATILAGVVALHYAWQLLNGEVESFDEYLNNMVESGKGAAAAIGELVGGTTQQAAASTGAAAALTSQAGATTGAATASMQMNDGIIDLNMTTEEFTKQVNANAAAQIDWAAKTVESVEAVKQAYDDLTASIIKSAAAAPKAGSKNQDINPATGEKYKIFNGMRITATDDDIANYVASLVAAKSDIMKRPNNANAKTSPQGYNNLNTNIRRFAGGGSMRVKGSTGGDRNVVAIRANGGERIDVKTRQQQKEESQQGGSAPVYNFYISTPNADSFMLSRNQMANNVNAALA